ncbi:MAG: transposase [Kiritimatiellaeota bacterium]|nr:transposase [Kiritimatiellota bacterium]
MPYDINANAGSAGLPPCKTSEEGLPPGNINEAGQKPCAPGTCAPGICAPGTCAPGTCAPGTCALGRWYSRGYLPHRDEMHLTQSLTFRLADSLPQEKLRQLEEELRSIPAEKQDAYRRIQIENWVDTSMGCCALRHAALAEVVEHALCSHDGTRYHLLAWCVMPNHVHVLIKPLVEMATITRSWKGYSGHWAMAHNAELGLGIFGETLWQRETWDRYMRDEKHLHDTVAYIHNNPVKAGLCGRAEEWRWSSAWKWRNDGKE